MEGRTFGYIRVSTKEQNDDRQRIALHEFGITDQYIYADKISGRDFKRPQYIRMIRRLRAEDVIVVKSIDRLGRNYTDILEQWRLITQEKGAYMVVLDMPLLDTSRNDHDMTGTFIADMVLQILSYDAQTERENIRSRQAEGIAAARLRGVKFGRKPLKIPEGFEYLCYLWHIGSISSRKAGKILGVSYQTFLRWAKAFPPETMLDKADSV